MVPSDSSTIGILIGAIGALACGAVRDLGKSLEGRLWESWGGPPTRRLLQWRGDSDRQLVSRNHELLEAVLKRSLPTQEDEFAHPAVADQAYDLAVADLRELTRDRETFSLILEENSEYGFRRNMLGIRPVAIAVAVVVAAVSSGLAIDGPVRFLGVALLAVAAATAWIYWVKPDWVRRSAERYAERLLGAAVLLTTGQSASP